MPLNEPERRPEMVALRLKKVEKSFRELLQEYAAHLNSSEEHVVMAAVRYAARKDEAFQKRIKATQSPVKAKGRSAGNV